MFLDSVFRDYITKGRVNLKHYAEVPLNEDELKVYKLFAYLVIAENYRAQTTSLEERVKATANVMKRLDKLYDYLENKTGKLNRREPYI